MDAREELSDKYKKLRPKTRFYGYAVTDKSNQTIDFYESWLLSSTDPEWATIIGKSLNRKFAVKKRTVKTINLDDLLAMNKVSSFDFLSIDIEGSELQALEGFSIDTYKPRLVCIEKHTPEYSKKIHNFFKAHNYEIIKEYEPYDKINMYFRKRK